MKNQEYMPRSIRFLRYFKELFFPKADINISIKILKEKIEKTRIVLHIPYRRSLPSTATTEPCLIKKQKVVRFNKVDKSIQVVPRFVKDYNEQSVSLELEVPEFKLKQKIWKLLPIQPDSAAFAKLYERLFPFSYFKVLTSENLSEKIDKKESFADDSSLQEKISIENTSNVSDSFITPEESPILSPSPAPKIKQFNLESPLIHSISANSVEGWGLKSSNLELPSPHFPRMDNQTCSFVFNHWNKWRK